MIERRNWARVALCGWLVAGCGDTGESAKDETKPTSAKAAESQDASAMQSADDDAGAQTQMFVVQPPASCDHDDPTTSGVDCAGFTGCGGTLEAPVSCDNATSTCCVNGLPTAENTHCVDGVKTCDGMIPVLCDGPEDCGDGEVCCVQRSAGFVTQCVKHDDCHTPSDMVQCHTDEDCDVGLICHTGEMSPWWGGCR